MPKDKPKYSTTSPVTVRSPGSKENDAPTGAARQQADEVTYEDLTHTGKPTGAAKMVGPMTFVEGGARAATRGELERTDEPAGVTVRKAKPARRRTTARKAATRARKATTRKRTARKQTAAVETGVQASAEVRGTEVVKP